MKLTRLREVRERKVLSQRDLAERAKVDRTTIARLEAGEGDPHPRTIRRLAEALGVEPLELWTEEGDEKKLVAGAAAA